MQERYKGWYKYPQQEGEAVLPAVPFEIEWTNTDVNVQGYCVDDEAKEVFDSPATVNGFFDETMISFIKMYPCYWDRTEDGDTRVFREFPAPEIHYFGNRSEDSFEGEWEMTVAYEFEDNHVEQHTMIGTWWMEKII